LCSGRSGEGGGKGRNQAQRDDGVTDGHGAPGRGWAFSSESSHQTRRRFGP
jgi:hypothetical protein